MIVGSGLLARAFSPRFGTRADVLIFASGVSNSLETSASAFTREKTLLQEHLQRHDGKLVYFGSCSVVDADRCGTSYARHKLEMESLVLERPDSLVIRLPQVVGRTGNPTTLTNFLYSKIMRGECFPVWSLAERNLVDVDDVADIGAAAVDRLRPGKSHSMAIASPASVSMPMLVSTFERILGRDACVSSEPKGTPLCIEADEAHAIAAELGIDMGEGYIERILRKYYGDLH